MTSLDKNINPESKKHFKNCMNDSVFSTKIRVKKPPILKILQRNRYQKRSVYYFCDRNVDNKLLQSETVKNKSPFDFSKDVNDFSYRAKYREKHVEMREKAKLYKYYNRPNYRSRINEGKLERLYVSTADMELPGKSLTGDIDPEFFSIVSGRPIKEKFNVASYLKDLQSIFLIRLQIGYKYDETYLMQEIILREKKLLEKVQDNFQTYSNCFNGYLEDENVVTLDLLIKNETEMTKFKKKGEKIKDLLKECADYRTKILILDEQWQMAKIFQKFLYQISPLWWRKKFDYIHKNKGMGDILISDNTLSGKQVTPSMTTVSSNQSWLTIVDRFIDEAGKSETPRLYFTDPNEFLQILNDLERNNLLALLQCEELLQPAQKMALDLEKAHRLFKHEVNVLRDNLKSLEEEVIFEENRTRDCEQKAKIITFGLFKDLIVDKYTLNLYVNVEDCFESCVAPNDSSLTLSMMMKGVEYEVESLMSSFDKLPKEIVHKAMQTCYREDAKIMKEAHEATKIIVQIENLMKTLRKSLEPKTEKKKRRKLVWRSEPPLEKIENMTQICTLTKEQLDYLYFFTDFCPTTESPEVGKQLCDQKLVNINL